MGIALPGNPSLVVTVQTVPVPYRSNTHRDMRPLQSNRSRVSHRLCRESASFEGIPIVVDLGVLLERRGGAVNRFVAVASATSRSLFASVRPGIPSSDDATIQGLPPVLRMRRRHHRSARHARTRKILIVLRATGSA